MLVSSCSSASAQVVACAAKSCFALLVCVASALPALAADPYVLDRSFALPVAGEFDTLPDGRLILLDGSEVLVETSVGSATFATAGSVPGGDFSSFGPGFVKVSPDGTKVAIGNSGGASFAGFQVGVFSLNDFSGAWFDVDHFDAAWYDDTQLALTAGAFGAPAVVTLLDTESSPAAPTNPTVIAGIGGASAGVGFDDDGRLYTGNGFAGGGPSHTGTIKAIDLANWSVAVDGGPVSDFETTGTELGEVLSAGALAWDHLGNLLVAGGDFSESDSGYVGVIAAAAVADALAGNGPIADADIYQLDPDTTSDSNFYDVVFNDGLQEVLIRDGATVHAYRAVPEPGGVVLMLAVGGPAACRRRELSRTASAQQEVAGA